MTRVSLWVVLVLLAALAVGAPAKEGDYVIDPGKGLGPVKIGDDLAKVQKFLGKEDYTTTDGEDTVYSYERYGFSVCARANAKGTAEVSAVWVSLPLYKTAKDVGVGSLLEAVRKAYGEEDQKANSCLYYTRLGLEFHYFKVASRVIAVKVTGPAKKSGAASSGSQQTTAQQGTQAQGELKKLTIEPGRGISPPLMFGSDWEELKQRNQAFQTADEVRNLDGGAKVFQYNALGLQLIVAASGSKAVLTGIILTSPKVAQYDVADQSGVTVGIERAQVLKVYGSPESTKKEKDQPQWDYYNKKGLAFIYEGTIVNGIYIFPARR